MWALILLSSAVLIWARWMQHEIELGGVANREIEARAMAHSGVSVALHPLVTKQTPLLQEEFSERLGYRVRLVSEGGKLNIRWLLAEEDPRRITILKQWLERKGLDFKERETFVDCLLDYVDGDDLVRLNGMEDEGEYRPANRPLESVEEIAEVPGAEALVSKPGWKDELTIYSHGPIDVTAASPEILRLLPGLSEARIQRLIIVRQGPDKLDGTLDDRIFAA
jgi:type II secretory pathway component PulK